MPKRPEDPRFYLSTFLLDGADAGRQPCGCWIERMDDNPKEAIAHLCLMHAMAPTMYDCLRQIVTAPLRGDDAVRAATEALTRLETVRINLQIGREQDQRRREREARKQHKKPTA